MSFFTVGHRHPAVKGCTAGGYRGCGGPLSAHFQGWDVQAIRKESREQALIEARKQVEVEMEEVRKEVTQQVTQQVTESDIIKLLTVLHKLGCPRETAVEQLMKGDWTTCYVCFLEKNRRNFYFLPKLLVL